VSERADGHMSSNIVILVLSHMQKKVGSLQIESNQRDTPSNKKTDSNSAASVSSG